MRKLFVIVMVFLFSFFLVSCANETTVGSEEAVVSKDYGQVIEFTKTEFTNIFKEYENVHIEETSTMARTDGEEAVIVQIRYTSPQGDGVYGFEYLLEDYANPELMQHGANVTIDSFLEQ